MSLFRSLLGLTLLAAIAFGADPKPQQVTASVGKQFEVRLKATPSTGYTWEAKVLPKEIKFEGNAQTEPAKMPGASIEQILRFLPSKAGKYKMTLVYKRSWETTIAETQIVNVTVK